ncbi:MAG: hypothetical protein JNJ54_30190 [Myxococcaceae bacterium]|nr:hypothetical protein [Myxococcaceae bacterium]
MWLVLLVATLGQTSSFRGAVFFEPDAGFTRVLPAPWPDVISGAEVVSLGGLEPRKGREQRQRVNWRRTLEQPADVEAVRRLVLDPTMYRLLDSETCRCGVLKLCGRCDPNLDLTFEKGNRRVQFLICFHCSETTVSLLEHGVELQAVVPDLGERNEWLRVLAALVPDDDLVMTRKRRADELEQRERARRERAARGVPDAGHAPEEPRRD